MGLEIVTLGDLIEPADLNVILPDKPRRVIEPEDSDDELVTYLRVRYDGYTESGDEIWTSDAGSRHLVRVEEGDVVISHINALHGAVGVVPAEHEGHVVTTEYTVCKAKAGIDPLVVWSLLRSPEARADLLLLATGGGRTRVRWGEARKLQLPQPTPEMSLAIVDALGRADMADRKAQDLRTTSRATFEDLLYLDSPDARSIIAAFKPPR
jgi:type I restriction enzyme M protein